jgi:CheY-like chemotaxis protein
MGLLKTKPYSRKKPFRVLVLEDDLELSAVIEHVLRSIDSTLSLDWATSAEGAIVQLTRNLKNDSECVYDLIVADIFLDGKSTGLDVWRACQDLFPETPIIVTSALSLDRFFSTLGSHSISPPYLQKPFTAMECKQVFENMLRYASKNKWTSKNSSNLYN